MQWGIAAVQGGLCDCGSGGGEGTKRWRHIDRLFGPPRSRPQRRRAAVSIWQMQVRRQAAISLNCWARVMQSQCSAVWSECRQSATLDNKQLSWNLYAMFWAYGIQSARRPKRLCSHSELKLEPSNWLCLNAASGSSSYNSFPDCFMIFISNWRVILFTVCLEWLNNCFKSKNQLPEAAGRTRSIARWQFWQRMANTN